MQCEGQTEALEVIQYLLVLLHLGHFFTGEVPASSRLNGSRGLLLCQNSVCDKLIKGNNNSEKKLGQWNSIYNQLLSMKYTKRGNIYKQCWTLSSVDTGTSCLQIATFTQCWLDSLGAVVEWSLLVSYIE